MPIYEYRCPRCGILFERLHLSGISEVNCPSCGCPRVEREMSVFGFRSGGEAGAVHSSSCSGCSSTSCSTCK